MKVGLAIQIKKIDIEPQLRLAAENGFDTVQIAMWNMEKLSLEGAKWLKALLQKYNLTLSEFWCGWPKPANWNFKQGPSVLGLVPPEYRYPRLETFLKASEVAQVLEVTDIISHLGFLPVNPYDPNYIGVVEALKHLLQVYQEKGQYFSLETGQETPIVARRLIEDVGEDNFGINYDPANLILYGNANPIDGLPLLAPYLRSVHIKNGHYPTSGYALGVETPFDKGAMDPAAFLQALREYGFNGVLTIENEMKCSQEERWQHIVATKKYCEAFLASVQKISAMGNNCS